MDMLLLNEAFVRNHARNAGRAEACRSGFIGNTKDETGQVNLACPF
jgi:hypothetical protein